MPQAGFSGTDRFSYTISDGSLTDSATVTVTVSPANGRPVANDDRYSTNQNAALEVSADRGVLSNDSDPEGGGLTALLVASPSHGSLQLNPDGSFTFIPHSNYTGTDEFRYRASDSLAESDVARVLLSIQSINQAPLAQDDSFSHSPNQQLAIGLPGVLENDHDPDGQALSAELVSGPAHGSLNLEPDGSFFYSPVKGFTGVDTFAYRASDGSLRSDPATVVITIADKQPPAVIWVAPVVNEEIYFAGKETVTLRVDASDNVEVASVRFLRWDAVKEVFLDIGVVTVGPYATTLDTAILNYEWNQLFAIAYDRAGNASPRQFIWIFRTAGGPFPLFLPAVGH
jgi:hypothetical protein